MAENFLDKITAAKQKEVEEAKLRLSQARIVKILEGLSPDGKIKNHSASKRFFAKSLNLPGKISLIAEIKKASPSKGIIREDFNPVKIAKEYEAAGAQALSVLTDKQFFSGDNSFLGRVKDNVKIPVLRKDFIVDEYQIYESALIEANTEEALDKAIASEARFIGINNRNLTTFDVDIKTTERLIKKVPKDRVIVSESGIKTNADIKYLKSLGINAVLVGEAFMQSADIAGKVKEVMGW
ncbi:MAG: indole-3-glycerol phosphate synthase TrpC [Candidatus Omnitrophica bacterium]|nr:indole-3-glycerol phosphate synthase TrpC [Candidatus Omnitrophota bacterium]